MARIRTVKPEFFKDRDLAQLSYAHRLLFEGLWCQADRDGRLEDEPSVLKGEIFPYDDEITIDVMDTMLQGLHEGIEYQRGGITVTKRFINRYVTDCGRFLIEIINLDKHQNFQSTEKPKGFPSPPSHNDSRTVKEQLSNRSETVTEQSGREGKGRERNKPDVSSSKKPPEADSSKKILEETDDHNEQILELKEVEKKLVKRFDLDKRWPFQFVTKMKNNNGGILHPPEVFIRVFRDAVETEEVDDLWALCTYLFEIHSQNVNEERHMREHEELKGDVVDLKTILGKGGG